MINFIDQDGKKKSIAFIVSILKYKGTQLNTIIFLLEQRV